MHKINYLFLTVLGFELTDSIRLLSVYSVSHKTLIFGLSSLRVCLNDKSRESDKNLGNFLCHGPRSIKSNLSDAIMSKDILYYIAGVLITGGDSVEADSNKAELYVPSTGVSCSLPLLPDSRDAHTVSEGGLLCGGYGTEVSCIMWSPDSGTWEEALTLDVKRGDHVSWTPSSGSTGTYLMGGNYDNSQKTTTLITIDGSQEPGFPLKYDAE